MAINYHAIQIGRGDATCCPPIFSLFLMGITALKTRLLIDLNILEMNKWLYILHFTILVQWALIIVPFGNCTHFLYRSFGMCFAKLKEKVM
jgi:quinone-modifying oxidoreductase subunit QmoC